MKVLSNVARMGLAAVLVLASSLALRAQMNDLAVNKAKEFIQLLQKGDFDGAYQRVDSNLGFKLNPQKLGSIWQGLTAKAGSFKDFKEAKVENASGYTVVTQVVQFEKGHVDIKVALDNSLRVADMRFLNHQDAKSEAKSQAAPGSPAAAPAQSQASAAPAAAPPAG